MAIDLNELATAIGQLVLRFRLRRRLAADWTDSNEVLLSAEFGYESDTGKMKIGDGATAWNALSYWAAGGGTDLSSRNAGVGISIENVLVSGVELLRISNTGAVNLVAGEGISIVVQPETGGGDADWANVSLMMHFDGSEGDVTTFDSSPVGLAVTTVASASLSSATALYGSTGGHIPTAAGNWSTPDSSAFDMGSGDWTIEGSFYPIPWTSTSGGTTTHHNAIWCIGKFANLGTANTAALAIVYGGSGQVDLYMIDSGGTAHHLKFFDYVVPNDGSYDGSHPTYTAQNPNAAGNNKWNTLVVERVGTHVYAYMNGWQMGYNSEQSSAVGAAGYPTARGGYDIGTITLHAMTSPFLVGAGSGSLGFQFYGGVDEVRVTKGVGRYDPTALTYTLPTEAFWSTDTPVVMETVITNTRAGIVLSGRVDTYAGLPSLSSGDAGKAYLNSADNKVYVWSGTAWPANGAGASLS